MLIAIIVASLAVGFAFGWKGHAPRVRIEPEYLLTWIDDPVVIYDLTADAFIRTDFPEPHWYFASDQVKRLIVKAYMDGELGFDNSVPEEVRYLVMEAVLAEQ